MKKRLSLILLACLCITIVWSQNRQVSGRVVSDSTRQPLNGATVSVKGTAIHVVTNSAGNFSISVPDKNDQVLVISYIGYSSQEVPIGNKTVIDVMLNSVSSALGDIVVIGYQTVRRRDNTFVNHLNEFLSSHASNNLLLKPIEGK